MPVFLCVNQDNDKVPRESIPLKGSVTRIRNIFTFYFLAICTQICLGIISLQTLQIECIGYK